MKKIIFSLTLVIISTIVGLTQENNKTIRAYQQFKEKSTVSASQNTNTWTSLGPFTSVQSNDVSRVNVAPNLTKENICGFDQLHQNLLEKDPAYKARMEREQRSYVKAMSSQSGARNNNVLYKLPVVVHIIHGGETIGTENNPSDISIKEIIQHTTERFRHTSGQTFANPYSGVNAQIELCLTSSAPNGSTTPGIIRHHRPDIYDNPSPAQLDAFLAATRWDISKYLNVYILNSYNTGTLQGLFYPPADVLILEAASIWDSRFVIHETGHYLSLRHTFQIGPFASINGCSNFNCLTYGDQVCDTPPKAESGFDGIDCGVPGNSCTSDDHDFNSRNPYRSIFWGGIGDQPDMRENYMDYGGHCMAAFSQGQSAKMRAYINSNRMELVNHAAIACAATTVSICSTPPTGLSSSNSLSTSVTLNWNPVANATSYQLAYSLLNQRDWTTVNAINSTAYTLTNLSSNTAYTWRIRSLCNNGFYSDWSFFYALSAPATTCNLPTNLISNGITSNSVNVSWENVTGASSYNIRYKPVSATTWLSNSGVTVTMGPISGLSPNTTYQWEVQANCNPIASTWSSATFTTTATPTCNAPTNLSQPTITTNSATLAWNGVTGATSYNLRYKATTATNWQDVSALTTTTHTITSLISSTAYEWEVQANCSSNISTWVAANFSTTSNGGTCPSLPDLIVDEINVITATTQTMDFTFTIKNIGGVAANMTGDINNSADNIKFHTVLSADANYDNTDHTLEGPQDFVAISSGFGIAIPIQGTSMRSYRLSITGGGTIFNIDTHPYLIIVIDTGNDLVECSETNNTKAVLLNGGTTMDNLSLNDTPILEGTYCANIGITSTGTINSNKNVIMKAGTSIQLLPGFHSYQGANLHAYIDDCAETFIPETTEVRQTNSQLASTTNLLNISPKFQLKIIPNPVQRNATIHFHLPIGKIAAINLLNLNGQSINQQKIQGTKGWNSTQLDASQLSAGVYFIALQTNTDRLIQKIIVSR